MGSCIICVWRKEDVERGLHLRVQILPENLQNAVTRPRAREASNTGSAEMHQCHGYQPDALHASCGTSHQHSGVGEMEPYGSQGTLRFQLKT